jgi:hypothetical protein
MMQNAITREAGPPVARALPDVTKRPVPGKDLASPWKCMMRYKTCLLDAKDERVGN